MTHPNKREFYDRMGFCECATCKTLYYDYEEYESHECTNTQGIHVHANTTIADDTTGDV